jgi:ABC-2 type transport system ATP-binding protein
VSGQPLADPAISLQDVSRRFGPARALDDVDQKVAGGEIVVLVGANGAGKSTLLRIVATTMLPDSGGGTVAGLPLLEADRRIRARLGVVLGDERAWYWRLSGRMNLEFFAALDGLEPEAARGRAIELLDLAGLTAVADKPFSAYSTGMRLRLSLARALIARPAILLLDEPTRSVDLQGRRAFHELLLRLGHDRRAAILLATHDLDEAVELGDRIVVLADGRVVAQLTGASRTDIEAALSHR